MAISLYDATCRAFIQGLGGLSGVLAKGRAHAEATGVDPDTYVKSRIAPDMLPLTYQVQAACSHSLGALEACESGVHVAKMPYKQTYAELQAMVTETRERLKALQAEAINGAAGRDVVFRLTDRDLPFETEDYLMTFSVPNFYFHATTAYDILRGLGVPLSKGDFMGRTRMKA